MHLFMNPNKMGLESNEARQASVENTKIRDNFK